MWRKFQVLIYGWTCRFRGVCESFAKDHVLFSFLAALLELFWITLSKNFIYKVAQGKKKTHKYVVCLHFYTDPFLNRDGCRKLSKH